MEYLPENPTESEARNKEKTEKKLKEFREYIVNKGVVLAFVKVLLSLKYADKKPKNPIKAIREFFGKYKDPRWEEMGALQDRIVAMNNENSKLMEEIVKMEEQVKEIKRNKKLNQIIPLFELDKNGLISTKWIIEKLTGNKKFEVDERLEPNGIITFFEAIVEKYSEEENVLFSKFEEALNGNPIFKEDLENPIYDKIVKYFIELKKNKAPGKK